MMARHVWYLAWVCCFIAIVFTDADEPQAILITLDNSNLRIRELHESQLQLKPTEKGMVVWRDRETEYRQFLTTGGTWSAESGADHTSNLAQRALTVEPTSRSRGAGDTSAVASFTTTPLAQLQGMTIVRGTHEWLTPTNGRLLGPTLNFRRKPPAHLGDLAPATATLTRAGKKVANLTFALNQPQLSWTDFVLQNPGFKHGLDEGEYVLRMHDGNAVYFQVENADWRNDILAPLQELLNKLPESDRDLINYCTVLFLLSQYDENGKPLSYVMDAFDRIGDIPTDQLPLCLVKQRGELLERLMGKTPTPTMEDLTGIRAMDDARQYFLVGQWKKSLSLLDEILSNKSDQRAVGLSHLYRALVMGESGLARSEQAEAMFVKALDILAAQREKYPVTESDADMARAYSNYANFLLSQAQDRLHGHMLQQAAGVRIPLLRALNGCLQAQRQMKLARTIKTIPLAIRQALDLSETRLYLLLGDILESLETPDNPPRFKDGWVLAREQARAVANKLAEIKPNSVSTFLTRGIAREMVAQMHFRADVELKKRAECVRWAGEARQDYIQAGFLVGIESVERLLGLEQLRSKQSKIEVTTIAQRQAALKHFLLSHHITEFLSDQLPDDQIGLSLAGFLARRAYIHEKIMDQYIHLGDPIAALQHAELSKARALRFLLATRGITDDTPEAENTPRSVPEILKSWPQETTAVAYFLGAENGWVFVINSSGKVSVTPLRGPKGEMLSPSELATRIRYFLASVDRYPRRLRSRLQSGKGFDHTWQDKLHEFFQILMPSTVYAEVKNSKNLLIIPHHILHYFPFSALVVERDTKERDRFDMAQPRFLLDQSIVGCNIASLTSWDITRRLPAKVLHEVQAAAVPEFPGAEPLPGVETDLKNLQRAFGKRITVTLRDRAATEPAVRQCLNTPGMFLIATHGTNVADQPLESYLLLHGDNGFDGHLSARELFPTRIAKDLIVMSACYTGLADRSPLPGDDLFGLQRAFLQGGARTVISGLWDVYDDTGPIIMGHFFEHLAEGKPTPHALALAQRRFLTKLRASTDAEPWLHPYFWAVYQVTGDERTRFGVNP